MLMGCNLYAYCGSNPVMYTDPKGTFFGAIFIGALVAGLIGGTIGAITTLSKGGSIRKAIGSFVGEFITSFVLGAASIIGGGLAVGALAASVGSIIASVAVVGGLTFGGGFAAYVAESAINGEAIDWSEALHQGAITMFTGFTNFGLGYAMGAAGLWNSLKPGNGFLDTIKAGKDFLVMEVGYTGLKRFIIGGIMYLEMNVFAMVIRSILKYIFTKKYKEAIKGI